MEIRKMLCKDIILKSKIMHSSKFKKFYKLNLKHSDILEFTIKNDKTEILMYTIIYKN